MAKTIAVALLVLALLVLAPPSQATAPAQFDSQGRAIGRPLSNRVVEYVIDARLDPKTATLDGRETLTWRNQSDEPQAKLWFHLYWNAFKNERSTFYREAKASGGFRRPFLDRKQEDWGYSDVKRVAVRGGAELLPTLRFEHPDDDNRDDRTVFTVTLPAPVPAGGTITLEIAWQAHVPRLVARTGRAGNFYMLGQWFPKIGVLEPRAPGAAGPTWNCHQFHAWSEFYADFGVYDVRLTVPSEMRLGATGELVDKHDNGDGTTSYRHHQDDVHDFAWTAWKDYQVWEERFSEPDLPEVRITLLLHPEHAEARQQYLAAIRASLLRYGRWWLPFPYPHLTLVDPPPGGEEAGGMEYPTLITLGASRRPGQPRDFSIWGVTAHEFGHNYWYGILASNEFEEAWLDEGINSYGTAKLLLQEDVRVSLADVLPPPWRRLLRPLLGDLTFDEFDLLALVPQGDFDTPIETFAWKFRSARDYGLSSYRRTELILFTLERLLGSEVMARVMRTYAERWQFRHPHAQDFFAVVNQVSGRDYSWFFDQFFGGTDHLDYGVESVACADISPDEDAGIFDDGKGGHRFQKGEKKGKDALQRCEVILKRYGGAMVPVEAKVTFDDGAIEMLSWPGRERWRRWVFTRSTGVRQVELDPAGALLLDNDRANNSHTLKPDGRVSSRLLGWLTYVSQMLLSLCSVLT